MSLTRRFLCPLADHQYRLASSHMTTDPTHLWRFVIGQCVYECTQYSRLLFNLKTYLIQWWLSVNTVHDDPDASAAGVFDLVWHILSEVVSCKNVKTCNSSTWVRNLWLSVELWLWANKASPSSSRETHKTYFQRHHRCIRITGFSIMRDSIVMENTAAILSEPTVFLSPL